MIDSGSGQWKYFAAIAAFATAGLMILPGNKYHYHKTNPPARFEDYLNEKLAESRKAGVRPDNEERLVRRSSGKTDLAFLYIHGFGASRAEGEAVMDRLSQDYKANLYYLRLPGHGTSREDQAFVNYQDYLRSVDEALDMMPLLGKKTVVFGTSTGGLLAAYLASTRPDKVAATVMVSPLFEFHNRAANIAAWPILLKLIRPFTGTIRDNHVDPEDPSDQRLAGYEKYWYAEQYYDALIPLVALKNFVARPATFRNITAPTLLLYYYRDEEHQDRSASITAMLDAFSTLGLNATPSPYNRAVAVPAGAHIMLSNYVTGDKQRVSQIISDFLDTALQARTARAADHGPKAGKSRPRP